MYVAAPHTWYAQQFYTWKVEIGNNEVTVHKIVWWNKAIQCVAYCAAYMQVGDIYNKSDGKLPLRNDFVCLIETR